MSDHNFEKQVQQKLDELKIPPADSVWAAIESQIRKDKRRRRGLLLFPLLFLILGAGYYFIFSQTDNASKNTSGRLISSKNPNPQNTHKPGDSERSQQLPGKNLKTENNTIAQADTDKARVKTPNKVTISQSTGGVKKVDNTVKRQNEYISVKGRSSEYNRHQTSVDANKKSPISDSSNQQNVNTDRLFSDRIAKDKNPTVTIDQKQLEKTITNGQKSIIPVPDSQVNISSNEIDGNRVLDSVDNIVHKEPVVSSLSDTVVEKKKVADKKLTQSGWRWGLSASVGISNVAEGGFFVEGGFFEGVLSGEKALVADVSNSSFNTPGANSGIPPTVYKPSAIQKGPSFSIGVFTKKQFSNRLSLSAGLQYNQYSTNIEVGNRIDSPRVVNNPLGSLNVSQAYRSNAVTSSYRYTNRFHFIEIPFLLNVQLTKRNHLPIFWNTGVSLSYLIATNALHFDGLTGLYYKDNSLFNKLQANLSTGFSVSLFNASKSPVHIGPMFQYGLTNLMKREVSDTKHLYYLGLNARFFMRK